MQSHDSSSATMQFKTEMLAFMLKRIMLMVESVFSYQMKVLKHLNKHFGSFTNSNLNTLQTGLLNRRDDEVSLLPYKLGSLLVV